MSSSNVDDTNLNKCENCFTNFTIIKRKKKCKLCNQSFCKQCVKKITTDLICIICEPISSLRINTEDLMKIKAKHLRCVLNKANIPSDTCREKRDFAELIVNNIYKINGLTRIPQNQRQSNQHQHQQQQNQSQSTNNQETFMNNLNNLINNLFVSTDSLNNINNSNQRGNIFIPNNQSRQGPIRPNQNTQSTQNPTNISRSRSTFNLSQQPSSNQPNLRRRASLSDIKSESDIEHLSIKQIKEILACNFVEYKGCCERKELLDKLKRLYESHHENKRLEKEINSNTNKESSSPNISSGEDANTSSTTAKTKTNADESDLCKICMESLIDCVLLDCGHMCSCIKCGKQLAECPMCRQNIVRVVRVFKS